MDLPHTVVGGLYSPPLSLHVVDHMLGYWQIFVRLGIENSHHLGSSLHAYVQFALSTDSSRDQSLDNARRCEWWWSVWTECYGGWGQPCLRPHTITRRSPYTTIQQFGTYVSPHTHITRPPHTQIPGDAISDLIMMNYANPVASAQTGSLRQMISTLTTATARRNAHSLSSSLVQINDP